MRAGPAVFSYPLALRGYLRGDDVTSISLGMAFSKRGGT